MSDFRWSYETGGPPSRVEAQIWEREFSLFEHRPPNPNATSETHRRGWGFEPWILPPPDCYEFAVGNLKRKLKLNGTDRFRPEAKYSILWALATYFVWLRTIEGTRWLLHLNGIQIVEPHPGYVYHYQGERLVAPQFGLRIYQIDRSARTAKPPLEYYDDHRLRQKLKEMLFARRGPSNNPAPEITDGMWATIGGLVRDWLAEKEADRHWPTYKPDRISGYVWARGLLWPGSQKEFVWTVIGKAEDCVDDNRLYRIQRPAWEERLENGVMKKVPPSNPGVVWTNKTDMHIVPLTDVDKGLGVAPQLIDAKYRCRSCDQLRCCTTTKGSTNDRLCMSCRGTQLESNERPSLQLCLRRECRNCPEHLPNPVDYINLVTRLNLSSDRVRRG
jgi:hypothetical protein